MFSLTSIKHIPPQTLKEWITLSTTTLSENFIVVDVRDSDYIGGHIINSLHIPSIQVQSQLQNLFENISQNNITVVVFHCMLSQQRGPRAALQFGRFLESTHPLELERIKVCVLDGGFNYFQRLYKDHSDLLESYESDLW